ncbi:DDHD domain-containing protein [Durotheca rogersii]|uniref:DDHD domain-containing protein n=1 Tax=Durotheca rogersii TaxID=419775 RepID=UPI00221FBEB6|nr:DDHD domain-containing protein [Durotheca rogersii]KAI5864160.1 DDHD domain-containing protein [Durotheca rogersii]
MPPINFVSYGEALKAHNFGSKCRLAPVSRPSPSSDADGIPPVNAQYFYASSVPIDDPLSTTTVTAVADPKSSRSSLRPFSPGDNNALEKAWLSLSSDIYRENHTNARQNRAPSSSLIELNTQKLGNIVHQLAAQHVEKHAREGLAREKTLSTVRTLSEPETTTPLCCPDLLIDAGIALRASFCTVARRRQRDLDREAVAQAVMGEMSTLRADSTSAPATGRRVLSNSGRPSSQPQMEQNCSSEPLSSKQPGGIPYPESMPQMPHQGISSTDRNFGGSTPTKSSFLNDGISGRPFARAGTPESSTFSPPPSLPRNAATWQSTRPAERGSDELESRLQPQESLKSSTSRPAESLGAPTSVEVTVGISRLHEVSLPALQMKPIYWSPVNDIATVFRATWFYRDDMRPIDPTVANQLEAGYRELKPHTETWLDELRCAVEVGPLGEEKVSHPLWPKPPSKPPRKAGGPTEPPISSNPFCAARCFRGEAAAEGSLIPTPNEDDSPPSQAHRKFDQYHVIYKNETTAYLLKPSLKPSAYYGRRPVAKILRGITIGIPVVRGFDYEVWLKKHEKKQDISVRLTPPISNDSPGIVENDACSACKADEKRGNITDLVLVIHGIGQKLAERVENYHFTHAINSFRRAVNIELRSDAVRGALRQGQNGIMVLPVNWRHNLSFEEGGLMKEEDKAHHRPGDFTLKDIEPDTIPAVRSMISDVMFDIPFYMSHHKPKMVAAMVSEANRVYRLWCRNNPSFSEHGRVHVIGHSLGSVMAIEVLSRQPTILPALEPTQPLKTKHFEFDTKNLFLLGSPAAFFLLLERGALLPRRGRRKPGANLSDITSKDIVGEAGSFGCLAVDNIYNVLAREDAVAYLLNGTIDPTYAASLKTAYVPSTSVSFLQSVGNAMLSIVPGASSSSAAGAGAAVPRPSTLRLPSQLELEVHDFSREEVAEKKAFLLNDNGQIDYFLRSGGGPLELQYLNMLSAHSSYWASADLIRMLCMEIGRNPGKANTLPAMRAVKAAKRAIPPSV